MLTSKVCLHDFNGNETWLIVLFPQTASFVNPKFGKHTFGMFHYCASLDQPAITRTIGSYLDGIRSDAKVSRDFKRWRRSK